MLLFTYSYDKIYSRFTSVRSLRYRGSKGLPLRLPWTTILYHFPNLRKLHFPVVRNHCLVNARC